jgi:hypothetical protein
MSKFEKTAVAAVAFAMVGSTLFGGAALAGDKHDSYAKKETSYAKKETVVTNTGGAGGAGGAAENNCLNLAVQVPILNLFGSDPSNSAACTATGGAGGAGGAGTETTY